MENKFTKGEWKQCCKDTNPHFVFADEYTTVCRMMVNDPENEDYDKLQETITKEQLIANAKLISAAPDMFDALITFVENVDFWIESGISANRETSEMIYNKAKEAIKKATE